MAELSFEFARNCYEGNEEIKEAVSGGFLRRFRRLSDDVSCG